jgi:MerR family transcriptional regulator/heat shock protein HspR
LAERTPVYVISVAARLLEVHPQTLRNYERAGFLRPTRTEGRRRLYSAEDIERLRHLIRTVEQYGLNLSGLKLLLDLRGRLTDLRRALDEDLSPEQVAQLKARVDEMLDLLASTTPRVEAPRDDDGGNPTDSTP